MHKKLINSGWIEVICGGMFSGKTEELLRRIRRAQIANMSTIIFKPQIDTRYSKNKIVSHNNNSMESEIIEKTKDIFNIGKNNDVVGVDEAQFLTDKQVWELSDVVEILNIPVMCFGLRTDFQGKLFEGSSSLLAIADELKEIKTICHCGKKANMVVRVDSNGKVLKEGAQIEIGGNEKYISLCRKHWKNEMENNR